MNKLALLCLLMTAVVLSVSGCTNPLSGPTPQVTFTPTYAPPTFTPIPTVTATPAPPMWNGEMVKLSGNVTVKGGEHVYGSVRLNYMDEKYWDEHPTAKYDTDTGGAYTMDVRANVPFKVTIGYLYTSRLPLVMNTMLMDDKVYTLTNDTRVDFEIMSSNATIVK